MLDISPLLSPFFEVPTYHLLLELSLVLWVVSLLLKKSYNPQTATPLTEKEKEELIRDWIPEPLVSEADASLEPISYDVLEGKAGKYLSIGGSRYLNLCTSSFLGMTENEHVQEEAVKCLRQYGVGSCGPRAFFGTIDVHLDTEKRISQFMGTQETCLYSLGFSTVASVIPAYAKRSDIIYADESVCFSIQKGLQASRSKIVYFRHNDCSHLEQLLLQQEKLDKKNPKKAAVVRRFLVSEGIFAKSGDLCCLPELLALKKRFRLRLFLEETFSFAVLGATGRGVLEHFGVFIDEVDLVVASLETALGSTGGFTTGSSYIVDHQRLSAPGYVFSASLAPLCAAAAKKVIDLVDELPHILTELHDICLQMHAALSDINGLSLGGDDISPLKFLYLSQSTGERRADEEILQNVVKHCRELGVAVAVPRYLESDEHLLPPPSIRITCSRLLLPADIQLTRESIVAAALKFLTT